MTVSLPTNESINGTVSIGMPPSGESDGVNENESGSHSEGKEKTTFFHHLMLHSRLILLQLWGAPFC